MHAAPRNWNDQSNTWEKEGELTRAQTAPQAAFTQKGKCEHLTVEVFN